MVIEDPKPCPLCQRRSMDKLTGLADRWGWESKAPELLRGADQAALLLIDVDRFKQINDVWGHQAGDQALVRTAQIVRAAVDDALVGRYGSYGGDEFLVVLPADSDHAVQVAGTIRARVRGMAMTVTSTSGEHATLAGVTVSVGVAVRGPTDGWDLPSLISSADGALQQAKRNGRDRVCVANHPVAASTASPPVPAARSCSLALNGHEQQHLIEVCRVMRGRWTPDVLMALWSGPHSYDELLDRLRNASASNGARERDHRIPASTLVRTLRRLDRSGLIRCTGAGRAARYELSPLAHDLADAVVPGASLPSQQRTHFRDRVERSLAQAG